MNSARMMTVAGLNNIFWIIPLLFDLSRERVFFAQLGTGESQKNIFSEQWHARGAL
jgi:hypothetical protein